MTQKVMMMTPPPKMEHCTHDGDNDNDDSDYDPNTDYDSSNNKSDDDDNDDDNIIIEDVTDDDNTTVILPLMGRGQQKETNLMCTSLH